MASRCANMVRDVRRPDHAGARLHPGASGFRWRDERRGNRDRRLMRRRQGTASKASALPEIERRREDVRRAERARKLAEAELTSISQKIVKLELQMTGWRMKIGKFSEDRHLQPHFRSGIRDHRARGSARRSSAAGRGGKARASHGQGAARKYRAVGAQQRGRRMGSAAGRAGRARRQGAPRP